MLFKFGADIRGMKFDRITDDSFALFDSYLFRLKMVEDNVLFSQSFFEFAAFHSDVVEMLYKEINGCLCTFVYNNSSRRLRLFTDPIGKEKDKEGAWYEIESILIDCNDPVESGSNAIADYVSNCYLEDFCLFEGYKKKRLLTHDMVYKTDDLIAMSGQRYKSARRMVNRFASRYDYRYIDYDKSMFADCLRLYDRWKQSRYFYKYYDMDIIRRMLQNYERFGLYIKVCFVDNNIVGFGITRKLCADSSIIISMKTDIAYEGCSEHFWRYLVESFAADVEHLEYEEDGGYEYAGLRAYKQKFLPCIEKEIFTVVDGR